MGDKTKEDPDRMPKQIEHDEKFLELKRALQSFQQNRLRSTYMDMMENPDYSKMAIFFFEKLYAPEDFSFRDASIKKLHKVLKGAVYKGMVSAISMVIELHELSDDLDDLMVEKMIENGVGPDMTMEQYQDVYRQLDNYDQRVYQIKLPLRPGSRDRGGQVPATLEFAAGRGDREYHQYRQGGLLAERGRFQDKTKSGPQRRLLHDRQPVGYPGGR